MYVPEFFKGVGVEVEYMIVDIATLSVRPLADALLRDSTGGVTQEIERGPICFSNELAKHLIELKTNGPAVSLSGLAAEFSQGVKFINSELKELGAMLLPTAMHPLMIPASEAVLWEHDGKEIYEAYNKVFNCSSHGWTNLQSIHINLPFRNSRQFALLHAATRIILPIIPGLASSSPLMEGQITGIMDTRLEVYRSNQQKIPSITGDVIPERVFSRQQYEENIFNPISRDMSLYDPDGILQGEWVNSRGAIARFDRQSVEIRLVDAQECPSMDMAVAAALMFAVKAFVDGIFVPPEKQMAMETEPLAEILKTCIIEGDRTIIKNKDYLSLFGVTESEMEIRELWRHIIDILARNYADFQEFNPFLQIIFSRGTLSSRILRTLNSVNIRNDIIRTYRLLAESLNNNTPFIP